ncbi:Cell cycle checkpoint protein rad17 [Linnemannia zychae]|nr:Cell cycle checkpoint protein rad17 [Linnemannia zychae]
MPPKRTLKKPTAAPVVRRAPTREAKTRSAATTASLYKESEAYLKEDSLSDISDPISDIESDSDDESFVKTRGGNVKKASASSVNIDSNKRSAATTVAAKKGNTWKNDTSSAQSSSNSTSSSSRTKRKASELKFSPLKENSLSSQSSSTAQPLSNTSVFSSLTGEDQWAEKYAPRNIDDVVVHKSKIGDVREWLQLYTSPTDPRKDTSGGAILVLTGPAGSGKTAVLRNLAKDMGLNIIEWINSVNSNSIVQRPIMPDQEKENWRPVSLDEEYIPVMRSFQEFFSRAHRFSPLQLSSGKPQQNQTGSGSLNSSPLSTSSQTGRMSAPQSGPPMKNIILIEDLPPVSALSSRKIFQDTITNFANSRANTSSVLVIIISDVFSKQSTELQFSSTRESSDPALTMRTLLPSVILGRLDSGARNNTARIRQIKFNPIAPTFLKKALKNLVVQEFNGKSSYEPTADEIDQLIRIHEGDVRSVINALQFHCYLPKKRREKIRQTLQLMEDDQEGLTSEERSSQAQDSSLGIFHAVAKVLYNKRKWYGPMEEFDCDIVKVPSNAWNKKRPPMQFNPEKDLIEKLPVEPDLFTLMLHQNYMRHMGSIEECSTAMEYLCIADQFQSPPSFGSSGYTQTLQMQPYMTSLAVRGMLFAPTSAGPASVNTFGGPKKHWWPEIFTVNRTARANDEMFAEVSIDLAGREAIGHAAGSVTGPGFIPKAVIRQEIVPMLHKCLIMDPYRLVFQQFLRGSTKAFVRHNVGAYGTKSGFKKEFGEGDEGFTEDLDNGDESAQFLTEVTDDVDKTNGSRQRSRVRSEVKPTQQQGQRTRVDSSVVDDDPIEDFSD